MLAKTCFIQKTTFLVDYHEISAAYTVLELMLAIEFCSTGANDSRLRVIFNHFNFLKIVDCETSTLIFDVQVARFCTFEDDNFDGFQNV